MGRELVIGLVSKGATAVAVDLNGQSLDETVSLAGDLGKRIHTFVADISDQQSVEQLYRVILARLGSVDGIINNAGIIQPFVKMDKLGFDAIEKVLKVNLYGTLYVTKIFLPHLMQRPEAHIVNISSMGGFLPVPGQTIYGASKAAVKLLTEGLHSELKDTNVRVTVVFPGAVHTNIALHSGLPAAGTKSAETSAIKMLTARKAAAIILEGMEKNRYRVLVGRDARFMDFLYRLNPSYAAGFIQKKMKSLLS